MSKYTTELRFICESLAGYDSSQGYGKVSEIIDNSWDKIFDFDFPIFDTQYKSVLCKKILKHYYTREIGFETYGLWKLKLDTKLNEIMPYYNQRYSTTQFEFDPLNDVKYTKKTTGDESGINDNQRDNTKRDTGTDTNTLTGTDTRARSGSDSTAKTGTVGVQGSNQSTDQSIDKYSDTPQGGLSGVVNGNYLTNARVVDSTHSGSGNETTTHNTNDTTTYNSSETLTHNTQNQDVKNLTTTENESNAGSFSTTKEYVEEIAGKMGGKSYAGMIDEYRNILINIDMEIIDELGDLFMKLW